VGQSFINDSTGNGTAIKLYDWTFGLSQTSISSALTKTLDIYRDTDNSGAFIGTNGTVVGSSTVTSLSSFAGGNSVTWTFTGGLDLIDNATYYAIIRYSRSSIGNIFLQKNPSGSDPYLDGLFISGATPGPLTDTVFQANFSPPTPVPFEFDPTGGLMVLGGGWLLRRHLKKKKSTKV
jgi:hypothetical protein